MDAKYFLDKLKSDSARDKLRPNLTAFLVISRGIVDHLLEEYNVKLGLIPLSEKLYIKTFEEEAKRQSNVLALNYIKFYKSEFNNLKSDPVGNLIFGKRDIAIHRISTSFRQEFAVHIFDTVNLKETISVRKIDKNGNTEHLSQPSKSQEEKQVGEDLSRSEVESKWFFTDYSNKEGADICRDFLNLVRDFVNKVHKQFPLAAAKQQS